MDLSLTESQQLLKQSVEDFIEREAPRDTLVELQQTERGFNDTIWKTAAETGWLGMLIPEQYGGGGAEFTDAAVVYEALGHAPMPGPMFSSGVLSAQIIQHVGSEEQRQRHLPAIASGEVICTFALTEPEYRWGLHGVRMRPREDGEHYVLDGAKLFVYDAHAADYVITAVRTGDGEDDIGLLMVDTKTPGISTRRLGGFTSSESEVIFQNARVPKSALLGRPGGVRNALDRALMNATPLLCAYQVGGAQAVFDLSVKYSRERVQFGRPIGRFQFVQNHIVQLVNHLDAARWTTYEALWKLDSGREATVSVHLAKAVTSEGYREACDYAHEVHAGTGVMREYGLTLFTRLSRSLYHALGEPRYHRKRLADLVATIAVD
ncbi:MAG: acyl-CoA dehydrogenase [Chloroflexi bacterium]|nr:acyl-CoA dehydrogenase [Chloroflexota bacterium]